MLPAMLVVLSIALSDAAPPIDGRLLDARTGSAIAGADLAIAGQRGSVRTDAAGRFHWPIAPPMPATLVVILPDGRAAPPVRLTAIHGIEPLIVTIDTALTEMVVVLGAAPGIDAPPAASTTLLTASDLELRHPPTLAQALDGIPGVSAVSEGQGAVPAIRGLARGRTLVLVDGSRATTERRAGASASFLDPGSVETIEVARGPGSVAYGSDAFGGVIAARTRGPDYDRATRLRFSGTAGGGVPERRGDLEIAHGYGSGGVLVAARARRFDDYDGPDGTVANSQWQDRGVRARWEQMAAGGVWSVGWQSDVARAVGRPRSDSDAILATSPFDDSHRLTGSYDGGSLGGFRNIRVNALAGFSRQQTDQDRLATPARPRSVEQAQLSSREMQVRVTGERVVGRARLHVGADLQGRYGFEALDTVRAYSRAGALTSEATTVSVESARRTGVGFFAEAEAQLAQWVRLSGGLRVDTVRSANAGGFFGDRSVSHAAPAGLVAATLLPTARLGLTAQVARGFRDPILTDRFYRGPVGRGFVEGNPDLKPEKSLQFDLTARYDAGPVRLVAAGYHYRITDLVERYASTPTLFLVRNRGHAELQGVEVEAQATLTRGFSLAATAEASRGRDADDGTPIDDVAPGAASVTLRHAVRSRVASYVRVKAVAAHDAAGPSEVPTRRYTLVDGGASWRLTPYVEVIGAMRNLLNEAYQSSAGPRWVWAAGRHGSVTMVVGFNAMRR